MALPLLGARAQISCLSAVDARNKGRRSRDSKPISCECRITPNVPERTLSYKFGNPFHLHSIMPSGNQDPLEGAPDFESAPTPSAGYNRPEEGALCPPARTRNSLSS